MGGYLFNILTKLTQVKDLVLTAGPGTLRSVSGLLARLGEGVDLAAQYLERIGGENASATPPDVAAGLQQTDSADYLLKLQALKAEVDKAIDGVAVPAAAQGGPQSGLLDNINPDTKKMILSFISQVLLRVLTKSGVALVPQAVPAEKKAEPKAAK